MLLLLSLFLTGSHGLYATVTVKPNESAMLPCPLKMGDVTWSRYRYGRLATLVAVRDGVETQKLSKHYSALADNTLFIQKTTSADTGMYYCNKSPVYLDVTSNPNMVAAPVTPGDPGGHPEPDHEGPPETTSDLWKVPVGVVAGAAAVLLVTLTLRLWSRTSTERRASAEETEVVYEEIPAPRGKSCLESPYEWSGVGETARTSGLDGNHVYEYGSYRADGEGVDGEGVDGEGLDCEGVDGGGVDGEGVYSVYSLAGNPTRTENVEEQDDVETSGDLDSDR